MSKMDDNDSDYQSSSAGSYAEKLKEDPWDIHAEFSEHPPHDTTSFELESDEQLLFYQRSRFPIHCLLAHTESEVVITERRVIITQGDTLRGIPGIHANSYPYRMRQHVVARDKVAGYSSGAVQPKCWHLLLGKFLFIASFFFLIGGDSALYWSFRVLNPLAWMRTFAGGHCREIGLCGGEPPAKPAASLMQLTPEVPLSVARLRQADAGHRRAGRDAHARGGQTSGGSFLELRSSGHLLATPSSHPDQAHSTAVIPIGGPPPMGPVSSYGAPTKNYPPECQDYPSWVDSDGAQCARYESETRWALSCVGLGAGVGTAPESTQRFDARRDSTALRLSALEACCVCGGGEHVGRNLGIPRLVDSLWPVVVAVSGSDSPSGPVANHISAAGKAVLTETFRSMSSDKLDKAAKAVATARTGEIVAGILLPSGDMEQLLKDLEQDPKITQVKRGLGEQPLPGLTMYALNLDMGDAQAQVRNQWWMESYAWLAYMQPILVCMLRALLLISMLLGLGLIGKWWIDQRSQDRLYVMLKVHKDYFGPARDLQKEEQKPWNKGQYKVEQLLAFYLPSFDNHPYRLREMSKALMAPFDGSVTPAAPRPAATQRFGSTTTKAGVEQHVSHKSVVSKGIKYASGDDSD